MGPAHSALVSAVGCAMPSFVNNDDECRYESSATPRENNIEHIVWALVLIV
jgi:hypothetical protein